MSALGLLTRFGLSRPAAAPAPGDDDAVFTWPNNPGVTAVTIGTAISSTTNQVGATYKSATAIKIGSVWLQLNATAAGGTVRIWRVSDETLLGAKTIGPSSTPLPPTGWLVVDLDTLVEIAATEAFTVTYQSTAAAGLRLMSAHTLGAGITRVGGVNQAGTGFPSTPTPNIVAIAFDAAAAWDWVAAGSPPVVDVLLVGAGGRGGSGFAAGGGGGGAGQVRSLAAQPVSGNASVFVGSGHLLDKPGGSTYFGALVALGGGNGGGRDPGGGFTNAPGGDGGSGGGGGMATSTPVLGGGSLGSLGHAGGTSTDPTGSTTRRASGGGGGAGAVGTEPIVVGSARRGGDGGSGVTLESLGWGAAIAAGAPASVGGGGGGGAATDAAGSGTGGLGGGGNGSQTTTATDGQPGTGGGGGGGNAQSGIGGTGLIIVRWVRP